MAKRKTLIYISIFIIGIILLLVPLITRNHIYQGVALGEDTMRAFIPMINLATDGNSMMSLSQYGGYLGLWMMMWLLGIMNIVLKMNPDVLFYLYSICVLIGASITLYYLGKLIGGIRGGWIMMVMGMLVNTSILALYTWGCTINIVNVYIVLIWAVILFIKWLQSHKWYWLLSCGALLIVFLFLHPTGAYLPFTSVVLFVGLVIWHLSSKKKINWWYMVGGLGMLCISLYLTRGYFHAIGLTHNILDADYLGKFIRLLLIPVPTVIGILALVVWLQNKRRIKLDAVSKVTLAILVSLLIVLLGASGLQATVLPERQILDASTFMAIIIAILLAQLIKYPRLQWLKMSSYALMALGSLVTIQGWVV